MKLPPFETSRMRWDLYNQFHQTPCGIPWMTQFITGEVICTAGRLDPYDHKGYSECHIRVIGTGDSQYPQLYSPDGEPLLKAWLSDEGQQTLILDLDTHRVARVAGRQWGFRDTRIPVWLRGRCTMYWAGPAEPAIGIPINVSKPFKWDRDEWGHIESMRAACEAWEKIEGGLPRYVGGGLAGWEDILGYKSFKDIPEDTRWRVARHGIKKRRNVTEHEFLTTKNI
jgi:hypothetical protein